ncbi:MAG: hypothetical protein R2877_02895 [Bdellovibrionota bacterium]
MRILSWILILAFTGSAFAQGNPRMKLRPKKYADIVKSANEIRSREQQIREYYMQLVLRKAQMDVIKILERRRMSNDDIQKVLASDQMKSFLTRLEKNPKIKARVEAHVQRLVRPGAIEAHVMAQRNKIIQKQHEQLLVAQNELRKSKTFRTEEKVHEKMDDRSLAEKTWDHLMKDLYKE